MMLTICYGFLVVGAVCACMTALWWLGVRRRRFIGISLIAGVAGSLAVCLPVSLGTAHFMCLVFLALFLLVILTQPEGSTADGIAASAVACACYGMIQETVGVVVCLEMVSLFFRFMLLLLLVAAELFLGYMVTKASFGKDWREYFSGEEQESGNRGAVLRFLGGMAFYGLCCALPVVADCYFWPVLLLEWFGFFGGLALWSLLLANRKERQTLQNEKQYRDEMQSYMSVIRSQRHDYNFHVQTLQGLLRKKDYQACESYLEDLMRDAVWVNHLLPLADAAVSALILSFQSRAMQSGIHMEIAIENDLSQIATNVYETNKVIGNLLQNALEETRKLKDKSYGIRLSVLKRGEFCLISVSNRFENGDPMAAYQVGHSGKYGHEGIGIASITALAARYEGTVYSRIEGDVIFFVAKIPLRIGKGAS